MCNKVCFLYFDVFFLGFYSFHFSQKSIIDFRYNFAASGSTLAEKEEIAEDQEEQQEGQRILQLKDKVSIKKLQLYDKVSLWSLNSLVVIGMTINENEEQNNQ